MDAIASLITGVPIVYSTVCSGADERKQQSSASLTIVRGIPRWPITSPYKGPVTRKLLPFHDVIMFPVNTTSWCPRRLGMDKVLWTSLCRLRMNGHGNDFMETCAMRDDNHKPALTTKRRRGNFQPIRLIESKESHQVSMTFCLRFEIVWTLRFLKIVCSNVILTLPKRH